MPSPNGIGKVLRHVEKWVSIVFTAIKLPGRSSERSTIPPTQRIAEPPIRSSVDHWIFNDDTQQYAATPANLVFKHEVHVHINAGLLNIGRNLLAGPSISQSGDSFYESAECVCLVGFEVLKPNPSMMPSRADTHLPTTLEVAGQFFGAFGTEQRGKWSMNSGVDKHTLN